MRPVAFGLCCTYLYLMPLFYDVRFTKWNQTRLILSVAMHNNNRMKKKRKKKKAHSTLQTIYYLIQCYFSIFIVYTRIFRAEKTFFLFIIGIMFNCKILFFLKSFLSDFAISVFDGFFFSSSARCSFSFLRPHSCR